MKYGHVTLRGRRQCDIGDVGDGARSVTGVATVARTNRRVLGLTAAALMGASLLAAGVAAADPPVETIAVHSSMILTGLCAANNPVGAYHSVHVRANFTPTDGGQFITGNTYDLEIEDPSDPNPADNIAVIQTAATSTSSLTFDTTITPAAAMLVQSYNIRLGDITSGQLQTPDTTSFPLNRNDMCTDIGGLVPVTPTRILDTRSAHLTGIDQAGPISSNSTVALQVLGRGGVPSAGVSAVELNLTVTDTTASGFLTAYSGTGSLPNASNLNWTRATTVANAAFVPVGSNGKVSLHVSCCGTSQLIADVAGYVVAGTPTVPGAFVPVAPGRALDTRAGKQIGVPHAGPESTGTTLTVNLAGHNGVPAGSATPIAAVLNVTVTQPTGSGYVTVFPAATALPGVSNVNYTAGQTVANLVVVPLNDGAVSLHVTTTGTVQLIADVAGYFTNGSGSNPVGVYQSITPTRLVDTRPNEGGHGALTAGTTLTLQVANGNNGTPFAGTVSAVVLNVTATGPTKPGYLSVYAAGPAPNPLTSSVDYAPGQTVANLVVAPVAANGEVDIKVSGLGQTNVVADVFGYFSAPPSS
jgi:hypothetical protein